MLDIAFRPNVIVPIGVDIVKVTAVLDVNFIKDSFDNVTLTALAFDGASTSSLIATSVFTP
ncbi:hypothetical protein D3C78_1729600 [compost metagenome]